MATYEDLFVEYMTIALNGQPYRLYDPDLFKCPSISEVNDGFTMYFADDSMLDDMETSNTVSFNMNFWDHSDTFTWSSTDSVDIKPTVGDINEDYTSDTISTQGSTITNIADELANTGFEYTWSGTAHDNYWHDYVVKDSFTARANTAFNQVYNEMTRQNLPESYMNEDFSAILKSIWAYQVKDYISNAPDFDNVDKSDAGWAVVTPVLATLVGSAFKAIQSESRENNIAFKMFAKPTSADYIEAIYAMQLYYYQAFGVPLEDVDYDDLIPTVSSGKDAHGYYIKCVYPENVVKIIYVVRDVYGYVDGTIKIQTYRMDINGFHEIFDYMRRYVEKHYIYLGVHMNSMSINQTDGSMSAKNTLLQNVPDSSAIQLFRMCDTKQYVVFTIYNMYTVYCTDNPDTTCVNIPYNAFNGSMTLSIDDITYAYFNKLVKGTADSQIKSFLQANVMDTDPYGYSSVPGLFLAVYDSNSGASMKYTCTVSKGTAGDLISSTQSSTDADVQVHGYQPVYPNLTDLVKVYNITVQSLVNKASYIYCMQHYPVTFLLFVEAVAIASNTYRYKIVDVTVDLPDSLTDKVTISVDTASICEQVVVYGGGFYGQSSEQQLNVTATYELQEKDADGNYVMCDTPSLNPENGAKIANFNVCMAHISDVSVGQLQTTGTADMDRAYSARTYNSTTADFMYGASCIQARAVSGFNNIDINTNGGVTELAGWTYKSTTNPQASLGVSDNSGYTTYWPYNYKVSLTLLTAGNTSNIITYTSSSELSEVTTATTAGVHTGAFSYVDEDGTITSATLVQHTFSDGMGTLTFNNKVNVIGENAFYGCNITSIAIPDITEKIQSSAFNGCAGLTSFDFPSQLSEIGESAFNGCTGLTSITIETSEALTIGSKAFAGCTKLTATISAASVTKQDDSFETDAIVTIETV